MVGITSGYFQPENIVYYIVSNLNNCFSIVVRSLILLHMKEKNSRTFIKKIYRGVGVDFPLTILPLFWQHCSNPASLLFFITDFGQHFSWIFVLIYARKRGKSVWNLTYIIMFWYMIIFMPIFSLFGLWCTSGTSWYD